MYTSLSVSRSHMKTNILNPVKSALIIDNQYFLIEIYFNLKENYQARLNVQDYISYDHISLCIREVQTLSPFCSSHFVGMMTYKIIRKIKRLL